MRGKFFFPVLFFLFLSPSVWAFTGLSGVFNDLGLSYSIALNDGPPEFPLLQKLNLGTLDMTSSQSLTLGTSGYLLRENRGIFYNAYLSFPFLTQIYSPERSRAVNYTGLIGIFVEASLGVIRYYPLSPRIGLFLEGGLHGQLSYENYARLDQEAYKTLSFGFTFNITLAYFLRKDLYLRTGIRNLLLPVHYFASPGREGIETYLSYSVKPIFAVGFRLNSPF